MARASKEPREVQGSIIQCTNKGMVEVCFTNPERLLDEKNFFYSNQGNETECSRSKADTCEVRKSEKLGPTPSPPPQKSICAREITCHCLHFHLNSFLIQTSPEPNISTIDLMLLVSKYQG